MRPRSASSRVPFNCDAVLNSKYSELAGIPIAWLGLAVYLILGAIILLWRRNAFLREYGSLLAFGLGLFAWLFSMWLVYVQAVLLGALCPWCLFARDQFHASLRLDLPTPLPRAGARRQIKNGRRRRVHPSESALLFRSAA